MSPPEHICNCVADLRLKFKDYLDTGHQHVRCILFPPEDDITAVCTCQGCRSTLDTLKKFEKDIQVKLKLVKEYRKRLDDADDKCPFLLDAALSAWNLVVFFQENLRRVYEKVGVQPEHDKLEANNDMREIILLMIHLLKRSQLLLGSPDLSSEMYFDPPPNSLPINDARTFYWFSKFKEKAYKIISQIELNEQLHENLKKEAEAEQKILDPSISQRHMEMQLELAKMLPVKELVGEIEDYVVVKSRKNDDWPMVNEAHDLILRTSGRMITQRKDFWRQYQEWSLTSKGKDERDSHSQNGFELTLDCLLREVEEFQKQWNTKYESLFNPDGNRNRSDPEGPCGDQLDPKRPYYDQAEPESTKRQRGV